MTGAIASHAYHSNYYLDKQAKTCYGLLQQSDHSAIKQLKAGSMSTDPSSYTVGYGKPPLHTRFKKGNPGRPRGSRNLKTLLQQALAKRIVVSDGGRRRRVTRREIGIAKVADRFAEGDQQAVKLLLGLLLELERRAPDEAAARPPLDAHDKEVVRSWIDTIRG